MTDYSQIPNCFYRIGVKALITDENGRFLLCREDDNFWDFPGGWLEHGEEPHDALRRELHEEAGLEANEIAPHPSYFVTARSVKRGFHLSNIIYKTTVRDLNITPSDECLEVRFFTVEEAFQMDIFPNVIAFCKQYNI